MNNQKKHSEDWVKSEWFREWIKLARKPHYSLNNYYAKILDYTFLNGGDNGKNNDY